MISEMNYSSLRRVSESYTCHMASLCLCWQIHALNIKCSAEGALNVPVWRWNTVNMPLSLGSLSAGKLDSEIDTNL